MDNKKGSYGFYIKLAVILALLGLLSLLARYYVDWLWFSSLGFNSVFIITLLSKIWLYVLVFVVAFLFLWLNFKITGRVEDDEEEYPEEPTFDEEGNVIYMHPRDGPYAQMLKGTFGKWVLVALALLGAFFAASAVGDNWMTVQQYLNSAPFGSTDPVFNKDISFYFFDLSFYQFVYGLMMLTLILTLIMTAMVYLFRGNNKNFLSNWREQSFQKNHLAV
ncbi:MAG: UPF0182 family protein, partial [Syntrophomonadaceae bacterium]|nr:UPF0182 family protein [Syntrophomonadaceae bacterium]